jgi:hypothetical protein
VSAPLVDDRLTLLVRDSSNGNHQGRVLCAEVEEASALLISGFQRHRAPRIEIGEEAQLTLPGLRSGSESFPARALLRSEDRTQVRYHFEVGPAVGWVLAKITDRRFAARVRPYPLAPIGASLASRRGGARFPVTVKDISATGIGLLARAEHEPRLFAEWSVRLWLQIPVDEGPDMELAGRVCSRRREGEGICYGIDFDCEGTQDFGQKQDVIHEYVASCQAAAIYMFRHGTVDLQFTDFGDAQDRPAGNGLPAPSALEDEMLADEFAAARELDGLAVLWPGLHRSVREAILVLVEAGSRTLPRAEEPPAPAAPHGGG